MGRIVNLGKEEVVKTPNTLGYRGTLNQTAYTSLTNILSVSGSGFLKSAFNLVYSAGPYYAEIKITVDGVVILDINNTASELGANCAQGIVDHIEMGYSTGSAWLPLCPSGCTAAYLVGSVQRSTLFTLPSAITQAADEVGCLFLIPEPIRFESSLEIAVKKEQASGIYTGIEYYLDD